MREAILKNNVKKKISEQIKEAMSLKTPEIRGHNKIAVCGMGGSGVSGYILKDLIDDVPVFVFQSYNLPRFVDSKTLVFVISYSGNTAETISMCKEARKRGAKIVIIASGGILGREKDAIKIPGGLEPREAIGYLFFPMWKVLGKGVGKDVIGAVDSVVNDKGIGGKLYGKIPVIYANSGFYSVALRWKQQINEDSKRLAIANAFPEINHNEIEARYDNVKIIFLKDKEEKAIKLLGRETDILEVKLKGKSKLAKIFYGIALANFVSVKLAELEGEDYLKYRHIEKLKGMK